MARSWSPISRIVLGAALLALATAACEEKGSVTRGFRSRQLAALRDTTFSFTGWDNRTAYYSTWNVDTGMPHNASIDADTGEVMDYGAGSPGPPTPEDPRYSCQIERTEDGDVLAVTDKHTGAITAIGQIASFTIACPTENDPRLILWRHEAGKLTLWVGPYDALVAPWLDLAVSAVLGTSGGGTLVIGGRPAAPEELGMFVVDLTTFSTIELVPPTLGSSAWADGATGSGELSSRSLHGSGRFVAGLGDHYAYGRKLTTGDEAIFVGPLVGDVQERALFRVSSLAAVYYSATASASGTAWPDPSWQVVGDAGWTLYHWRDTEQRLISCSIPRGGTLLSGRVSADGQRILFRPVNTSKTGAAVVMSLDPAAPGCITLAETDVSAASLSPDGASVIWVTRPETGDATIWAAASDGSGTRKIGSGLIASAPAPQWANDTEVELLLGSDLVWFDVRDDPVRLHYIAEQVTGYLIDVADWVLAIYDFGLQDETGRLAFHRRQTGEKRLISPAVASYLVLRATPPDPSKDAWALSIVYLVRGRNRSPDDGLWVATILESDLR